MIEILDQVQAPEWFEAMVAANIDIFEMSYEESVSCFKHLKYLGNIQHINDPSSTLPVDDKKSITNNAG
jgi:hypothetical protein